MIKCLKWIQNNGNDSMVEVHPKFRMISFISYQCWINPIGRLGSVPRGAELATAQIWEKQKKKEKKFIGII